MRTGKGFILVYTVTDSSPFEDIQSIYEQLSRSKDEDVVTFGTFGLIF